MLGSSPGRIQGYPQDEQHRQERTRETSLDRAKYERERERMTRRGCLQGLAESGNALFFYRGFFFFPYLFIYLFIYLFVVNFVLHWNETAMGLGCVCKSVSRSDLHLNG